MGGRRPTIHVNVPTRWATNYLVLHSILQSRTALQLTVASESWGRLPSGSQASNIRGYLMDTRF
jgi:hypothetical protein